MSNSHTQSFMYPAILICFILFSISCSSNNQSNQNEELIETVEKIEIFTHEIDSSLFLKYKTGIRSILEDSKGNIWFGSHGEGLCQYDGEKLTYYKVEDGLSNNQIRSIYEDKNGMVWFEGGVGISSYDGQKISSDTKKNYDTKQDWQLGNNNLWFKGDGIHGYSPAEEEPGVYRYNGKELIYHVFPIEIDPNEQGYYSISTPFQRGKNGRVWFGSYGAVFGYDGDTFSMINSDSLGLNESTGFLHVRSILEDTKGNLWIGNNGIGVLKYDGNSTINFSKEQGLISINSQLTGGFRSPKGSLEHVFAVGEDRDGNIWFGDRDTGAWRYDGKSMKNYTEKDGLTDTHIWQIYTTKKGALWFAMEDGSVCQFNGESFDKIF